MGLLEKEIKKRPVHSKEEKGECHGIFIGE
jgi:hypothetical protein